MAKVKLNEHFTFKKLLKISLGPILMMVCISIYSVVDGLFVSNFCEPEAFTGLNLIFPAVFIVGGLGLMFGTGGSALIGKLLGENKKEEAGKVLTNVCIAAFIIGVTISTIAGIFIEPIARLLASTSQDSNEKMIEYAVAYGRILMFAQPIYMLQAMFQSFLMVNEKPMKSFIFTVAAGVTNVVLDALFIGVFKWGIYGAVSATITGMLVGGVGSLIYFILSKDNLFNFAKFKPDFRTILKVITNGSSEFISNVSGSIVAIIFNLQLLKYFGNVGVSSYGVIQYVGFIFLAVFIGYGTGIAPAVSYHFGAGNKDELKNILKKSLIIISVFSVSMFLLGGALATPSALIFSAGQEEMITLTKLAMSIFAISFLFSGLCILISCYFTALNNGLISAIVSFCRCLIFQVAFVFVIPLVLGEYGIFWSIVFAEFLALILAVILLIKFRKKYGY